MPRRMRDVGACTASCALAPLVRETGMLLVVGWCAWDLARRRWREIVTAPHVRCLRSPGGCTFTCERRTTARLG